MEITEKYILQLLDEAIEIREKAYSEYSKFKVGAVVVDEKGEHHYGVNVENASYGLTICGERNAIFSGVTKGLKKVDILCLVADTSIPTPPCGACRQVLSEFSHEKTLIIMGNIKKDYKVVTMEEILPFPFKL